MMNSLNCGGSAIIAVRRAEHKRNMQAATKKPGPFIQRAGL
ncbi:hypothetical protein [Rhizobium sp. NFR07]|nr:hypothetical protein [Rhizobium sp. NFR07]